MGHRVVPFGYPRVKGRLRLTGDFRSLPRPSSPPRAKASAVRPCTLLIPGQSPNLKGGESSYTSALSPLLGHMNIAEHMPSVLFCFLALQLLKPVIYFYSTTFELNRCHNMS